MKKSKKVNFITCYVKKKADSLEPEALFALLGDESHAADDELPDTGVGLEWERILSAPFIRSLNYGTRSSTVLLIDRRKSVSFIERTFYSGEIGWSEVSYKFQLA